MTYRGRRPSQYLGIARRPTRRPRYTLDPHSGGLTYASELVALARSLGNFSVGVAAFPEGHREATSLDADARILAVKQDAGAEFAITELFFRSDNYFALLDRSQQVGVEFPIIPGIMPITNLRQIAADGRAVRPARAA